MGTCRGSKITMKFKNDPSTRFLLGLNHNNLWTLMGVLREHVMLNMYYYPLNGTEIKTNL